MSTLTAAQSVTEAIFGLLQDATLQTALGGRLYDDLPEDVARPCCLIEIFNEENIRGMGTTGPRKLEVRTHVFSDLGSLSEARSIDSQIVSLMDNSVLSVTGFTTCGATWQHETIVLPKQELNGIGVHEVVSIFTAWVE